MTKTTPNLKDRLAAVLKEEKVRHEQRRKELEQDRERLKYQLSQVEMQLLQLDREFQQQINQSLKEAGVEIEAPAAKAAKPKGSPRQRRQRGTNRDWILDQVKETPLSRGELMDRAEKAGLKGSSISHTLYALAKSGHLEAVKSGSQTAYRPKARG